MTAIGFFQRRDFKKANMLHSFLLTRTGPFVACTCKDESFGAHLSWQKHL